MYIKMNKWVDRHAAEQTRGEQTRIQTSGRRNKQRDRHVNRQAVQTGDRAYRWTAKCTDRPMTGHTRKSRRADNQVTEQTSESPGG